MTKPRIEELIDKAVAQDYILAPSETKELVELAKYYRKLAQQYKALNTRATDE